VQFKGQTNAKANARLMAAAPELLDALEELVERDRSEAADSGFTDDEMSSRLSTNLPALQEGAVPVMFALLDARSMTCG
jgi:hypothetical protein